MSSLLSLSRNQTNTDISWHRLRLFNYYRGTLALLFLAIYLNGWISVLIPGKEFDPLLFLSTSIFYLCSFFAFIFGIQNKKPKLETQVMLQTCIDVAVIMTMTHASGGLKSGLAMLLIINISMTSLFLPRQLTLLFAAATTLAILSDQIYSHLIGHVAHTSFTQAGMLGMLIFAFAFLASGFSRQLRDTEQLANEQERELATITQLNEHIIRSMRTGIIVLSADGKILMSNYAAENLLGDIKLNYHTPLQNIAPRLYERFTDWQSSDEKPQQLPIQQSHGLPDIQPGFSAIEKNEDKKGLTLVFLEDASQLNQRFQQIKLASLGRLTASIAHEIRNPLAAIQHAAQLLDESIDDPANQKLAHIIITQTQRLNGVVKNVLHLSRKQRNSPDVIQLNDWLQKFKNEFCPTHGMREQQIEIKITPETLAITFDTEEFHQIFWNLCSNSINHSGIDTHHLLIKIHSQISEDSQQPVIDIMDNGRGIDDTVAPKIFEPFYTTSTEGTGLGLYIIKEIVENNRAKIELVNQNGRNNCFRIHFMQPDTQPKIKSEQQEQSAIYV